jgi:type II secretory ATPase GspE/PulE/Tfp pilus assembly ATPase PilB-like protein
MGEPVATKRKLGEILIKDQLITEQQLVEALELQKLFPQQTLGQLLCRLEFVSESDLGYILEQKGTRQELTEILVQKNFLGEDKVREAFDLSIRERLPLTRMLLKLHLLDEEGIARALAIQYDLPYVHLDSITIDGEMNRYISASFAHKRRIIPVSRIGNTLTLAMAFPLDMNELKELSSSLRVKIIPVVASESEIILAQQRLYKGSPATPTHLESELEDIPDSIVEILSEGAEEPEVDEEVKRVTERDSVLVKLVNKIIFDAYQQNASDIHIEPALGRDDVIVRIRVDGRCKIYQKIPYKYKYALISRIKIMAELDIAERRKPQDGKINFRNFGPANVELRVATMPTVGHLEDLVIRLLRDEKARPINDLGLSPRDRREFEAALTQPYGMILVVGPTGSGKTTTLHSGIALINKPDVKIWTVEDPVEITQKGLRQVQINSRIGLNFAAVLRSFLRLDPDVIMVGEMRDQETADIAVEASLTGHLVLSTLHTNSAAETVTRLLEMGLDPYSFSDSLLCILAQRLARSLCGNCLEQYLPSDLERREIIETFGEESYLKLGIADSDLRLSRAVGCNRCFNTGYQGRIGLYEILVCTEEIKSLIKKRSPSDIIRSQALAEGMRTLKQDGILKVFQGATDIHEVRRVCIR